MSEHEPDDLLRRARESYEPSEAARQRMKSKIDAAVAAAAVASAAASSSTPAASAGTNGVFLGAGAKAATGTLLCATLIAASVWFTRPSPSAEPTNVEAPIAAPPVAAPIEAPIAAPIAAPIEAPIAAPVEPVEPAPGIEALPSPEASVRPRPRTPEVSITTSAASPEPTEPATSPETAMPTEPTTPTEPEVAPTHVPTVAPIVDTLAIELGLIDEARAAIARHDYAAARRALDAHALDFPRGAFRDERDVSRIVVLCATGREDEARRSAAELEGRRLSPRARADLRASCIE